MSVEYIQYILIAFAKVANEWFRSPRSQSRADPGRVPLHSHSNHVAIKMASWHPTAESIVRRLLGPTDSAFQSLLAEQQQKVFKDVRFLKSFVCSIG